MDAATADALLHPSGGGGGGVSAVVSPAPYAEGSVILAACFFTDSLDDRLVSIIFLYFFCHTYVFTSG